MLRLLFVVGLLAAAPAAPPAPARWVTDNAGMLSAATREALDAKLQAFERRTGHQVVVWIGETTGGEPIEQFAERAFKSWRVGRAGLDDGVVLFVFKQDRTLRLEVGYGLEPVLPDAICSRIIREQMTPLLAAGDADGAITRGVDGVLGTLAGDGPGPAPSTRPQPITIAQWVVAGVALLAFLVLLVVRPDLAIQLLMLATIFRGRGDRRSGGGGFSGGGGRSGGGGASGRW